MLVNHTFFFSRGAIEVQSGKHQTKDQQELPRRRPENAGEIQDKQAESVSHQIENCLKNPNTELDVVAS